MRSVLLLEVRAQIALASQSHFVGVSIYRSPYANFYNLRTLYAAAVASLMRVIALLFSLIFFFAIVAFCSCLGPAVMKRILRHLLHGGYRLFRMLAKAVVNHPLPSAEGRLNYLVAIVA